jgi:serine/threonine protein kinase/formylglycine-generating enzyme required for sulfatase activity
VRRLQREARAAATLDHPHICAVYEVGEADGRPFIAMQYVEGQPLDERVRRGPITVDETLSIAMQVVDALAEAHGRGVLHRDIKPANIMINARGDAKVMDFGLAKIADSADAADGAATASLLSARGDIIGTAPYMSPEQARGDTVDARSDLFSFGVVLYELISGHRPFQGKSSAAVAAAILTEEPQPLARFSADVPPELERIVGKLLRKQPDNRYQSAKDALIDLRTLKGELEFQRRLVQTPSQAGASVPAVPVSSTTSGTAASQSTSGSRSKSIAIAAIVAIAVVGAALYARRASNVRRAAARVPDVAALAEAGRYADAYDLAIEIEPFLPGDPALTRLMPTISDAISVSTDPPGATVFLRRFSSTDADAPARRIQLGSSPLSNVRLARGQYILTIDKAGYAPVERTVSGLLVRAGTLTIVPPPIRIDQKLLPAGAVPRSMVSVPGGDYRLVSWSRPTDRRIKLGDFFIDKYEVSNLQFKAFISAGGYVKREFWKHSFIRDGKNVAWEEAMRAFVDRTGLAGPRTWTNQTPPDGRADYPVTDISWYEADAYAASQGNRLASIYEWEKAARDGFTPQAGVAGMPWGLFYPGDPLTNRANFGTGPMPTTSGAFGMSAYGAYNMAGNVAEWTANDSSDGFLATGGAWGDPTYTFAQFGGRPGFFSSEKLGFRTARSASAAAGDQGAFRVELQQEVPQYTPSTPDQFTKLAASYRYDTAKPLEVRVEETVATPEWTREKITFVGANGARAIAYLYMPNNVPRPVQLIHFLPGGDVANGFRSLPDSIQDRMVAHVRGGRAVFGVVLDGYIERLHPANYVPPAIDSAEFADQMIGRITDLRRGLDYLETRTDIDRTRIAAIAPSAGSLLGMIIGAFEPRYRAIVFLGAGIPASYRPIVAVANPINFVSRITAPKLILQGRYDEDTPLRTASEPFYRLLSEPKRMVLYDGGHVSSIEVEQRETRPWLDEMLGRVFR